MKPKFLAVTAIIAALYIAVTYTLSFLSYGEIQFRIAEIFNHLVAFNPRYMLAVVSGVFIANLFSPLGWFDLVFGVSHSVICLTILIIVGKYVKNVIYRMLINSFVFTFMMWIIALELKLALELPFWLSWLTTAIGETVVLFVGIPIMKLLDKRLDFKNLIGR
ncbi:QueT transporter family protein [Ureibacillus sp. FSL K6-8385]|uniref:QueT transporter family protein n=1 Tax=Ureibacillus TaxID=160795 RepID=UPI002E1DA3C1|nr:QueT transporter family protein [Ureibacillus terrenus]